MSKPTKEYYQAKADLCRNLAIKQMVEGEAKEAGANLIRMVNALNEINLINYRKGKTMSKCVGVGNKGCDKEVDTSVYPDDTLCDQCFSELEASV